MKHKSDSLWTLLNNRLIRDGYLSYGQVAQIAVEEGFKVSTAERRLRKSDSPSVKAETAISRRGTEYISGYRYAPTEPTKVAEPKQAGLGIKLTNNYH